MARRSTYVGGESRSVRSSQNLAKVQPRGQDWAELIAHTARGEEEALAALYDDTSALVNGLALRILGDAGAAEEVTADVYLQIWRRAVTYDPARGVPLGWLLTLARSRAIDRLRTGATRRMRTERLRHAMAMPSNEPGPEERSALSERRRLVRAALGRLPAEQRRTIELAFFAGLSHGEIADDLRQPLGTVKTRIRLGMMRLRQTLAEAGKGAL